MAVEFGLWNIGTKTVEQIIFSSSGLESELEEVLDQSIAIASPEWMIVGRQVQTSHGKRIDILAINGDGNLVVVELKRNQTPREVVAQLLDYGSWVRELRIEQIAKIFNEYQQRFRSALPPISLDDAFKQKFESELEEVNESHELVVVAQTLDPETERIVRYLAEEYDVRINALFFRLFELNGAKLLARAWLQEPIELQPVETDVSTREPWNGEYYANFDHDFDWEAARRFGYVACAGEWYLKTFKCLEPHMRLWVNIPRYGYGGVGRVTSKPLPVQQFIDAGAPGLRDAGQEAMDFLKNMQSRVASKDPINSLHLAGMNWIRTVPLESAIKERGFFGNQNTIVQPRTPKWKFTIERLKQKFGVNDVAE